MIDRYKPHGTDDMVREVLTVFAVVACLWLVRCGDASPAQPSPSPTLQPSPTPPPFYPMSVLRRVGRQFMNDDGPVSLLGCIACCGGPPWPRSIDGGIAMPLELMRPIARASIDFMEECAAHGGLYTEWRNGPNAGNEGPEFDAYLRMPDGRYDLSQWNPEFWESGNERLNELERIGVYVGLDVIDNWVLRKRLGPWERGRNIHGFDGGSPEIKQRSFPLGFHRAWIRKLVKEWGKHRNIVWLEGNEDFTPPGISLAWAEGMARIIREAETEFGYPHHLIGSNAQTDEIERSDAIDFVIRHSDVYVPAPIRNKPTIMNETNPHSCAQFKREGDLSQLAGTFWQLWRSGMTDSEYQCALDALQERQQRALTVTEGGLE